MSENKTIKNFSAADIEKYWSKKLSPAEMHEMEKAAMDDPFFADALEGYQNSKDPAGELVTLKEKFIKKIKDETPVIPLLRKKYYWFRVAAAIIILVGSGLLIQQLVFKTKTETPIAVAKQQNNTDNKDVKNESNNIVNKDVTSILIDTLKNKSAITEPVASKPAIKNNATVDINSTYAYTTDDSSKTDDKTANVVVDKNAEALKKLEVALNKENAKKEDEKKEVVSDKTEVAPQASVAERITNKPETKAFLKAKTSADGYEQNGILFSNSYNYRVVDAQNNPVPFANVRNTRDNVGTYTDVRGNFNLVSSDSILNVQVKSLGFSSENYKLIPSKKISDIILKEDATARNYMNANRRSSVLSSAVRNDSADVVEPEVGWGNYNTYVENNIKIPETVRAKNNTLSQVELSFDVDKTGTPTNIKVTKSSNCKECDEEAIRLLKDGPKWKKKGKRSKTTISISVDQK